MSLLTRWNEREGDIENERQLGWGSVEFKLHAASFGRGSGVPANNTILGPLVQTGEGALIIDSTTLKEIFDHRGILEVGS